MKKKISSASVRTLLLSSLVVGVTPVRAAGPTATLSSLIAGHGLKSSIVKPPRGLLVHEYIVPDGPYFQLFDWDMYFMAAALSYDKVSGPVIGSVEDFLSFVDESANWTGYTSREIAPEALWALPEMCKPFLAQAAVRASLTAGDFKWLLKTDAPSRLPYYQKLKDTVSFWEDNRRAPDGLFVWYNGVESGADNNPAVSDKPTQVTEGVDLQCYLYREYLALALIAERLEKPKEAEEFRAKAAALKDLVQTRMWSEKDGTFWNIDSRAAAPVKIKTWTNLVPLWAGIATPVQAGRMIREHLLQSGEFWSPNGVRTVAKNEPSYDPHAGYWKGPVWILSNYLMMRGLLNYGFKAEAAELADKTERLLVADFLKTGGMNENYDPETGEPDAAGHFVSWNLLAEHMREEAASGADPTAIPER